MNLGILYCQVFVASSSPVCVYLGEEPPSPGGVEQAGEKIF